MKSYMVLVKFKIYQKFHFMKHKLRLGYLNFIEKEDPAQKTPLKPCEPIKTLKLKQDLRHKLDKIRTSPKTFKRPDST